MRADIFSREYEKNLSRYFFFLEQLEKKQAQGRKNSFKKRLEMIARECRGLDKRFYRELPGENVDLAAKIEREKRLLRKAA